MRTPARRRSRTVGELWAFGYAMCNLGIAGILVEKASRRGGDLRIGKGAGPVNGHAAVLQHAHQSFGLLGHAFGAFGTAVLEIGDDPGCPEAVIAELGRDAGRGRAPADHRIGACLRQHGPRELAGSKILRL